MTSINDILKLLEEKNFSEAEKSLNDLRKKSEDRSIIDYLLGRLYDDYQNPNRSVESAKRFYTKSIKTDNPVEDAFISLARLEHSHSHTIRILRQGIRFHPTSIRLYEMLLNWTESEKRHQLFQEIFEKGLVSNNSKATMIKTHFEIRNFDDAFSLIKGFSPSDSDQALYLEILRGFCMYELGDVQNASKIFKKIIDTDLGIQFDYLQYFGLILCNFKLGATDKALNVFEDIAIRDNYDCPFDYDFGPMDQIYLRYSDNALSSLIKTFQDRKTKAKARGIRAIIGGDEQSGYDVSRKKLIADLNYANKYLPSNTVFCDRLISYAIEENDFLAAHVLTLQYLRNLPWDERESTIDVQDYSYISQATESDFTKIKEQFKALFQKADYTDLQVIPKGPFVPLIERLFKEKQYKEITELADTLGDEALKVTEIVFEIAYSYGETSNPKKSKQFYEKHLKDNPNSHAVINNLGVLFEGEGDFFKAKEYFEKALSLDIESDLYKRNLQRIISSEQSAQTISNEQIKTKKNLVILWSGRDINDHLPSPNKLLSKKLNVSITEANKSVKRLIDEGYIIAVKDTFHKYDGLVYRINPFIISNLPKLEAEIERSTEILDVTEEITPDSLDRIGYDEKLTSCLKNIVSYDLQQLLKRDLRETALSILTKSSKTTLVLSGSIIEAVLLDKVTAKKITKYKMANGRNKSVIRMDLGELLIVANSEGLIDDNIFHLAHALRGFRNLIHPGLEKRKNAISVTDQNAKIAWDITRKLLLEM